MTMPTLRSGFTVQSTGAGAIPTINRSAAPTAPADDDYLLLIAVAGAGSNASAAPAGFETVVADTVLQGSRLAVYGKTVGADTSWTLTYPTAPTSGNNIRVSALFYTKTAGVAVKGTPVAATTATTGITLPSIDTTTADQLGLAIFQVKASSTAFPSTVTVNGAAPAYSNLPGSTFNPATAVGHLPRATPGATGTAAVVWDFSGLNQGGVLIALQPSELALTLTGSMSPSSADTGVERTLTLTAVGGNGNPITYGPVDWGDGLPASPAQSSNVFKRTPTVAGSKTWTANATQA